MEVKYWILTGVVTVTLAMIKWIFDIISTRMISKFEEVIKSINDLTTTIVIHTEQLKHNDEKITGLSARVHVVEEDVKKIELNCAECKFKDHEKNNR